MVGDRDINSDLHNALARAEGASPATRIDHRDSLAGFGSAIVEPLLEWVRGRKHSQFAICVFEALASIEREAALDALANVAAIDPSLADEVGAARQRLLGGPAPSSVRRHAGRRAGQRDHGVLDQVTPFGPPPASGPCMGITQKGQPCPNPGRYWVGDKLSCSRRHEHYR